MKYFTLKPEVPAGMGERTTFDKRVVPWKIVILHLVFEAWFGSDVMTTSPAFYVTEKLKEDLGESGLSGISHFEAIEVSKSENFEELYPDKELPEFFLFRINGQARKDDFGVDKGTLIVSQKAMDFLNGYNISEADIEEIES